MPQKTSIDLNDSTNRVIAAIVIALVFLGGWWLIARNVSTDDADFADDAGEEIQNDASGTPQVTPGAVLGPITDTPTIEGSSEAVDVADQSAGMSVMVQSATFAQVGWLAVRDAEGRTLGAGRFEAGLHTNVEIPLLRVTIAGGRYQVLIYVDDGDKVFDLHEDILVTNADGSVAGDIFTAQ